MKNIKSFIKEYESEYSGVSKDLLESEMKKRKVMSIINIFSILMQDQTCSKNLIFKQKILQTMSQMCILNNDGFNLNQELIFKSIVPEEDEDSVFDYNVFYRIKSDGPTLIVFVDEE